LFDNDGTLIDSTSGVYQAWRSYGKQYGFDGETAAHGLTRLAPSSTN